MLHHFSYALQPFFIDILVSDGSIDRCRRYVVLCVSVSIFRYHIVHISTYTTNMRTYISHANMYKCYFWNLGNLNNRGNSNGNRVCKMGISDVFRHYQKFAEWFWVTAPVISLSNKRLLSKSESIIGLAHHRSNLRSSCRTATHSVLKLDWAAKNIALIWISRYSESTGILQQYHTATERMNIDRCVNFTLKLDIGLIVDCVLIAIEQWTASRHRA